MAVQFKNSVHERRYRATLKQMLRNTRRHRAVAYLLTLDDVCYEHIDEIFSIKNDGAAIYGALKRPWQTETSVRTTRLVFNLWNDTIIEDFNDDKSACEGSTKYYVVSEIFYSSLAKYYIEAIKLRFPEIVKKD